MKTFIPAFLLSLSVLAAPAMALSIDMNPLTRTLSFPEPVSEPVTQDSTKVTK